MERPSRVKIKNEIIAEYLLPRTGKATRVLILLGGLPSAPCKTEEMRFWADKGYAVIFPRYRGTWESSGRFLKHSPTKDVSDILDALEGELLDLYSRTSFRITLGEIYILGSSFGAPAALFASQDPRVTRVIGLSSVIDWRTEFRAESLENKLRVLREGYGSAFRFRDQDLLKLSKDPSFYNPMTMSGKIDPDKTLLIHAQNDPTCPVSAVHKFAELTGIPKKIYQRDDHIGISQTTSAPLATQIHKWFQRS